MNRFRPALDLDAPGTILFFGSMNAMPMAYALELKRRGQDVVYFVDVPPNVPLCRPEAHYPDIDYPYPDWIIEAPVRSIIPNLMPRATLRWLMRRARRSRPVDKVKAVVLSGFFVALAPLFPRHVAKIFLSYGSDLETWTDPAHADDLARGMRHLSIFRYMPRFAAQRLVRRIVRRNFEAAARCAALVYFPREFTRTSSALIATLEARGVAHVWRYDIDFDSVSRRSRALREPGEKLIAISAVRFLYRTFSEGTEEYSKGNDIMIRGFAEYRRSNRDFALHLFEKGEDVGHAKSLARECGLEGNVVWHQPVTFDELLNKIEDSDIYCDQLGSHYMGTGMYAMYLGRPVIANTVKLGFLGEHPVLHAATPEELSDRLTELEDPDFRAEVARRSRDFAERRFSVADTVDRLLQVPARTAG